MNTLIAANLSKQLRTAKADEDSYYRVHQPRRAQGNLPVLLVLALVGLGFTVAVDLLGA